MIWNLRWKSLCQHFIHVMSTNICKGESSCTSRIPNFSRFLFLSKPVPTPVVPNSGKAPPSIMNQLVILDSSAFGVYPQSNHICLYPLLPSSYATLVSCLESVSPPSWFLCVFSCSWQCIIQQPDFKSWCWIMFFHPVAFHHKKKVIYTSYQDLLTEPLTLQAYHSHSVSPV